MKLNIEIDIELVKDFSNKNGVARVYYPNEGNKIQILKGLNTIELSEAVFHEIGHLIDWYISEGEQSENKENREVNADIIGKSLRFKKASRDCK